MEQDFETESIILDENEDKEFIEKWGIWYDVDPAWNVKDEDVVSSERR